MCIYCSICEIGGTGRQAYYYSITGAGHFHNRGLSVSQTETLRHINFRQQTDCYIVVVYYIGGEISAISAEGETVSASSRQHVRSATKGQRNRLEE